MSIASNMRTAGFKANLRVRGRGTVTDTEENVCVLVRDESVLADPDKPAQKETPVYVTVFALAYSVKNPRDIGTFTETNTGRVLTVFKYDETYGDTVSWKWFCETTREDFA